MKDALTDCSKEFFVIHLSDQAVLADHMSHEIRPLLLLIVVILHGDGLVLTIWLVCYVTAHAGVSMNGVQLDHSTDTCV